MVKIRAVRFVVDPTIIRDALNMPLYSTIKDIYMNWDGNEVTILVEHPDLPETEAYEMSQVPLAKPTVKTTWKWNLEDGNGKEKSTS